MAAQSGTQRTKWAWWISGGTLVLALVGLFTPTTTNAVMHIGEEVIEIEGEAPWMPPNWGGHTGGGAPNASPSGDSGGGGGGGGGGTSGSGSHPSGGQTGASTAQRRLAAAKQDCLTMALGTWGPAVFKDIVTNLAYAGYSCRWKSTPTTYIWFYYDSEGYLNQRCTGDLDVQTCEEP